MSVDVLNEPCTVWYAVGGMRVGLGFLCVLQHCAFDFVKIWWCQWMCWMSRALRLGLWFWHPCRCETRVRAQSQVVLCSFGICNVLMACESRNVGFELAWWHEGPSEPKVCGWPFGICNESGWHHTTVGRVGDIFGPSWFETQHVENENFDYTSPARKFLGDKWWGNSGSTG